CGEAAQARRGRLGVRLSRAGGPASHTVAPRARALFRGAEPRAPAGRSRDAPLLGDSPYGAALPRAPEARPTYAFSVQASLHPGIERRRATGPLRVLIADDEADTVDTLSRL